MPYVPVPLAHAPVLPLTAPPAAPDRLLQPLPADRPRGAGRASRGAGARGRAEGCAGDAHLAVQPPEPHRRARARARGGADRRAGRVGGQPGEAGGEPEGAEGADDLGCPTVRCGLTAVELSTLRESHSWGVFFLRLGCRRLLAQQQAAASAKKS